MSDNYIPVSLIKELAAFVEVLEGLESAYLKSEEEFKKTGLLPVYATEVRIKQEGIFIGEFRFWDDFWWWHPAE